MYPRSKSIAFFIIWYFIIDTILALTFGIKGGDRAVDLNESED